MKTHNRVTWAVAHDLLPTPSSNAHGWDEYNLGLRIYPKTPIALRSRVSELKGGTRPRPDGLRPQEGVDLSDDDQADGRLIAPLTTAFWPGRPPVPGGNPLHEVREMATTALRLAPGARPFECSSKPARTPSKAQAPMQVRNAAGGSSYRSDRRASQGRSPGQKGGSTRRTRATGSSPKAATTI